MGIPRWYFRLRDSGIFTVVAGAGYLLMGIGFLIWALDNEAGWWSVLLFIGGGTAGLIGALFIWTAGRVGPPAD